MKLINKYVKPLYLALGVLFISSCSRDANNYTLPTDDASSGIYLKTVEDKSAAFFETNFSTAATDLNLELGGKNAEAIVEEVYMYLTYVDSEKVYTQGEKLVATFKPSDFTKDSTSGMLRKRFVYTPKQLFDLLGITDTKIYDNSDVFNFRFAVKSKSGKIFTNTNLGDELSNTSYFMTPFVYSYTVRCQFLESQFQGNFTIVQDGWEDYGPGDPISVTYISPSEIRISQAGNPYLKNGSSSYFKVIITDKILGKATVVGNQDFDYGNMKVNPKGTAELDNCTGTISMSLAWGTYGTYKTVVRKK